MRLCAKGSSLDGLSRLNIQAYGRTIHVIENFLKDKGSLLLFSWNYNVNDLSITSQFYLELLKWWSVLQKDNTDDEDWQYIL